MLNEHQLYESVNRLLPNHPPFASCKEAESAAVGELRTRMMLAIDVEEPVSRSFAFDNESGEVSTVLFTVSQVTRGHGGTGSDTSSVFVASLREVRLLMQKETVRAFAARNTLQSWPGAMVLAVELRGGWRIELQLEPFRDQTPATRAPYERILNTVS